MSDEDAGRTRTPSREDDESEPRSGSKTRATKSRDESGFSFSLPPISLPQVQFPERVRLIFPVPEPPERVSRPTRVRFSSVLLVVLVVDVLDAAVVLWAGPETFPWMRGAVGLLASAIVAGPVGLLYAWELVATLAGFGWLAVAPTATALLLGGVVLSGQTG